VGDADSNTTSRSLVSQATVVVVVDELNQRECAMHVTDPDYQHDLGNGYLLRWGTPADAAHYGALAESAFFLKKEGVNNPNVAGYAHDLLSDHHPLCRAQDVAVVVDSNHRLVAAAALMRQPLAYGEIAIPTGRPELVCSDANVRNRGLIRHIMAALHAKSAARGDLLQAITGIPNYYHQFGYSWSIDYNAFLRIAIAQIPTLPADAPVVRLRRVGADEYTQWQQLYAEDCQRRGLLVTAAWSYEYFVHVTEQSRSSESYVPYFLVGADHQPIGYVLVCKRGWEGSITLTGFGVTANQSMLQLCIPMLHACKELIPIIPKALALHPDTHSIEVQVDGDHPFRKICEYLRIPAHYDAPYTWYLRIPDIRALLWHLRETLDARLSQSPLRGYHGQCYLSLYHSGLVLTWHDGKLTEIKPWSIPAYGEHAQAAYPPQAIAQHIFGWRSLHELRDWYPDVWATPETALLLDILFPKQPSWLLWMN
jgi:hypothetical protein